MTSNAGSSDGMNGIGFAKTADEMSKERAMKGLKDFLRPEFLARVDEVVAFKPLTEENYAAIAKLNLEELRSPLLEKNIELYIDNEVYKTVAKKAFGGKFGGRDIRRVIRTDIEDRIAELLIDNNEEDIKSVEIGTNGENIEVTVK